MKCSWFSTPPSSSSTPSTQESTTSEAPDTYPNGKCPRKCICAEKYFGNVCEYLGDIVADYESQIRRDLQPAPPRPTRECLVELATRGFWLEKGQDMPLHNPSEDLDLTPDYGPDPVTSATTVGLLTETNRGVFLPPIFLFRSFINSLCHVYCNA
jgi:hypothetical protein